MKVSYKLEDYTGIKFNIRAGTEINCDIQVRRKSQIRKIKNLSKKQLNGEACRA